MAHFREKLAIILRGHILNPIWLSHSERRKRRGLATQDCVCRYLHKQIDFAHLTPSDYTSNDKPHDSSDDKCCPEKIVWTLWLQGEENVPAIIQTCLRSMREHIQAEVRILSEKDLFDYIDLPPHIIDKWKAGKIRAAHFADICRIELLYRYGGVWADASDYFSADLPAWLWDCDFFVYQSGEKQRGFYSFIQNCFIRAKKGSYLLAAWREAIYRYWEKEEATIDYFTHQLLFKMLVENNAKAAEEYEKMPKLVQDSTHSIWFDRGAQSFDAEEFKQLCSQALFQKTEYKSSLAQNPPKDSYAAYLTGRR